MKQVLVMGGTEFVGKAFLQQLINLGYSVDFLTTGRRRSTISGYTTHIKCNRKKRSDLTAALKHKQYHYIVDISAYDRGCRQFIHIADVLRTILATFENRHAVCQSYNLAHRETITWKSLMSTFKKITNSPSKIIEVEQKFLTENEIGSKQFFPFRDVSYLMDTTKLTNDGLPTPAINLEKGLERSYKWFKQQRDFVPPRHSMNKVDFILNAYTQ
ncbi:NAD-dependent epimerase/dehydratase family protein [Shouchella clausii]|uniref:NAD-dependent epimerase/dehydratase family protein n=1 Tax=Shouchella TaxID=2893057 RepID=UPI0004E60D93|nr:MULTISPECIES: NAD-dependent epimerase/dehydratase family protein [Shouchella]ALA53311.1 mRNA-binding protein [Shouchella clausii]MBU3231160.1 NAD-dependent epimerase/dehydratase family protein [Shouchella clausii]MBU3263836.1 NAD-dependent epimerase/dehydratase family protein [Shouchella clausii]MBU3508202.1 NAD-dependent epimerase/dehydratase family protein [Shouchella clausii]MBU3535409.1 NAD-dependent epimerase/dehydratase family protein [Shouchella clausii]